MLVLFSCMRQAITLTLRIPRRKQKPRPKPRLRWIARGYWLCRAFAAGWNLVSLASCLRQPDGDRLFAALHLASATPRTETSTLQLVHLFSDFLFCLSSIATSSCATAGALAGHARPSARRSLPQRSPAPRDFLRCTLASYRSSRPTTSRGGARTPRTCCGFPCCHG